MIVPADQSNFADLLQALKVSVKWDGDVDDVLRATKAGRRAAREYLKESDDVSPPSFLGGPWTELGKDYPAKMGIFLIAQGCDPDADDARAIFAMSFDSEIAKHLGQAADGLDAHSGEKSGEATGPDIGDDDRDREAETSWDEMAERGARALYEAQGLNVFSSREWDRATAEDRNRCLTLSIVCLSSAIPERVPPVTGHGL